jgi:hypothetical protein
MSRPKNRRSVHGRQGQPDREVWLRAYGTGTCRYARPVRRMGKAKGTRRAIFTPGSPGCQGGGD